MSNPDDDFAQGFASAASSAPSEPEQKPEQNAEPPATEQQAAAPEPAAESSAPAAKPAEQADDAGAANGGSNRDIERELQDALHRERSSANRISAVMRQNNELANQLKSLQDELNKLKAAPSAAAAPASDEKDILDQSPDLRNAVAKRVEQAVAPLQQQLQDAVKRAQEAEAKATTAVQTVEPIGQREQLRQFEETWAALDKELGQGWRSDVKDAAFQTWVDADPDIKRMYATARTPQQSLRVMRMFYAETGRKPAAAQAAAPAAAPAAAAAPVANPNQDRLRQAAGIPSRGASRAPVMADDDFAAGFRQSFRRQQSAAS